MILMTEGLSRGVSRWGPAVSFLPCVSACAAAALCEQVWAAGWRGPRKKKALWRLFMLQEAPACLKTKLNRQERRGRSCCWLCVLVWSFTRGERQSDTGCVLDMALEQRLPSSGTRDLRGSCCPKYSLYHPMWIHPPLKIVPKNTPFPPVYVTFA